jgi:hypothetical protein
VPEISIPTSGTNPDWPGFFLRASGQESKDGLGATFNSDGRLHFGRASMQSHDFNNLENLRQSNDLNHHENLRQSYDTRASYGHELQIPIRILDDGRLSQVILNRVSSITQAESENSPIQRTACFLFRSCVVHD